jgi:hypothetical protein
MMPVRPSLRPGPGPGPAQPEGRGPAAARQRHGRPGHHDPQSKAAADSVHGKPGPHRPGPSKHRHDNRARRPSQLAAFSELKLKAPPRRPGPGPASESSLTRTRLRLARDWPRVGRVTEQDDNYNGPTRLWLSHGDEPLTPAGVNRDRLGRPLSAAAASDAAAPPGLRQGRPPGPGHETSGVITEIRVLARLGHESDDCELAA